MPDTSISLNLPTRVNRLMRASSRLACARSGAGWQYTMSTGRRERVYAAPREPLLCSRVRRVTSVVMPVYRLSSAQRRM